VAERDGAAIDRLLAEARYGVERVRAADLARELAAGALVVDIRPVEQRERDGELPGAVVIDRNVLEWRLDPASDSRVPVASYDLHAVVLCQEGYSSSLAAASLQRVGLSRATDVIGGMDAWLAAWLPTVTYDDPSTYQVTGGTGPPSPLTSPPG